ncbi:hypothetical protein SDC9_184479 [bioreactor metagenome]|uniref:Uncharacterized protein n=1 Tax=bioreactor metagenome TaxID=1076179 RepID=A0A645HD62_9ZZZZ
MKLAQGIFQSLNDFFIFDRHSLPVARFVEQTKFVAVGKTLFVRFQFHPPAPEFAQFRRGLHVDANSQTIEKESIIFALSFADIRAKRGEFLDQSALRVSTR